MLATKSSYLVRLIALLPAFFARGDGKGVIRRSGLRWNRLVNGFW